MSPRSCSCAGACSPCRTRRDASAPPSDQVEFVVRSTGVLQYPLRGTAEIVKPGPSSLGRASDLVGLPVQGGAHGAPEVGRIVAARVSDDGSQLIATMRLAPAGLAKVQDEEWGQASAEYECETDGSNVQRNPKFRAVALVPRSRCGTTCSWIKPPTPDANVHHDATDMSPSERARAAMIQRSRTLRPEFEGAPKPRFRSTHDVAWIED